MSEWPEVTLGELCHIARGGSPRPIKSFLTDSADGINWIKIGDATAGDGKYISSTQEKIRPEGLKMSRLVEPGDFLLSNSMSFGRPYILRTTGCIHDGWLVLRDKSHRFDPDYLYCFLGSDLAYRQFDALAAGSTVRNLNTDLVKTVKVVLPPLEEQRRIVAMLDEAFAAIATATANAEKNLANARELFEAAFRQRFDHVGNGWQIYNLPEIGENWDYLRRPVTKSDRVPGDVPYYGASGQVDSVRDHLFDDDLLLISEDGANLLMRTYPIAFSISGKSWVNNHAHILKFDDMATQRLVEYYLNSISLAPWVSGMAQPKLNQKALNSIPVPLPPKSERAKLVGELDDLADRIERLEANQEQKLATLAALKQSLLHRAFTGELTAATPNLAVA